MSDKDIDAYYQSSARSLDDLKKAIEYLDKDKDAEDRWDLKQSLQINFPHSSPFRAKNSDSPPLTYSSLFLFSIINACGRKEDMIEWINWARLLLINSFLFKKIHPGQLGIP